MIKRRSLIVRTLTGAVSATVFTTAGWLMGTRTLTMECNPCPPGSVCNQFCDDQTFCVKCATQDYCKSLFLDYYGCNGEACNCYCSVVETPGNCYFRGCGNCWSEG